MKSPFRDRWDRNYERMALAAAAAAVLGLAASFFGSAAFQAAAATTGFWSWPPSIGVPRLWALVSLAAALFVAAAGFVCFTLTKISPRHFTRFYALRLRISGIGIRCLGAALLIAGLWVAVNVAIALAI